MDRYDGVVAPGFGPGAMTAGDLVLAWRAADPARTRELLSGVGFASGPGGALAVPGLVVRIEDGPPADRLAEVPGLAVPGPGAPAGPAGSEAPRDARVRLLAVGWATVDLERAAASAAGAGDPLPDDVVLGARARATRDPGRVLLEPSTEGRLTATLARHGEGPAAVYLAVGAATGRGMATALRARGERPRAGEGPFGPELLAWSRPPWGPHVILVPVVPGHPPEPPDLLEQPDLPGEPFDVPELPGRPATRPGPPGPPGRTGGPPDPGPWATIWS